MPANLLFRLVTSRGAVGYPVPRGVETGQATVTTTEGPVTIRMWYA
ncbi:DUF7262 family protein [Halobacterium sp. KA-6]